DYSATNGGDLFRSGTQSPPSLSQSSGSGKFDGLDLFSAPNQPPSTTPAPAPLSQSSGSGKFDGLDLFDVPNQPPSTTPAPAPLSQSLGSGKFGLPTAPYAPQSTTTTPPTAINLFDLSTTSSASVASTLSVNQQFKAFEPSVDLFTAMPKQQSADTLNDKSADTVTQKNDGWASFDMPWHAEPSQNIKSSVTVSETSTSDLFRGKFDQTSSPDKSSNWSFQQDFSASGPASLMNNPWQGGVHDIGVPVNEKNNQQSWSFAWGISENLNMKQADLNTRSAPFLSTTPYALDSFDSSSELPVQLWSSTSHMLLLQKFSRNPFDFPSDTDLDPSNMFLDMSSVHSALPNHNMSTPWFPESATISYSPGTQDALVYMAGQAPSMQIPNIQAQGPVASIGGNPFG
ncbi:hypothetical protein Tco_1366117, partial [Tanacetum coccineum]